VAQGSKALADQEGGRKMTLNTGSRQGCTGQNEMEIVGVAASDQSHKLVGQQPAYSQLLSNNLRLIYSVE